MSSTLKVDILQDSGGNTILSSDGSGNVTQTRTGIIEADQWRLTTGMFTDGDITSIERVDTDGFEYIGTGMTQSSGIFTFPKTGIYLITVQALFITASDDNQVIVETKTTTDNSTYNVRAAALSGNTTSNEIRNSAFSQLMFNVTNTTTHKIKFTLNSIGSNNSLSGDTNINYTSFTFLRLGDT